MVSEIRTAPLSDDRLEKEVEAVLAYLDTRKNDPVELMWGWAYECEDQWKWLPARAGEVRTTLAESGLYGHGEGDLHVRFLDTDIRLMLCHEGDVHVETDDDGVLAHFLNRWKAAELQVWRRAAGDEPWERASP